MCFFWLKKNTDCLPKQQLPICLSSLRRRVTFWMNAGLHSPLSKFHPNSALQIKNSAELLNVLPLLHTVTLYFPSLCFFDPNTSPCLQPSFTSRWKAVRAVDFYVSLYPLPLTPTPTPHTPKQTHAYFLQLSPASLFSLQRVHKFHFIYVALYMQLELSEPKWSRNVL